METPPAVRPLTPPAQVTPILAPDAWAAQTFGACDLGDARRTRRLVAVAARFAADPGATLPAALAAPAMLKADYRLPQTEAATVDALTAPHRDQTRRAASGPGVTLLIQDTTELDSTRYASVAGLGPIGNGKGRGFLLQSVLAVRPGGAGVLGLAALTPFLRQPQADRGARAAGRRHRARESDVWPQTVAAVGPPPPGCTWVHVGDRGRTSSPSSPPVGSRRPTCWSGSPKIAAPRPRTGPPPASGRRRPRCPRPSCAASRSRRGGAGLEDRPAPRRRAAGVGAGPHRGGGHRGRCPGAGRLARAALAGRGVPPLPGDQLPGGAPLPARPRRPVAAAGVAAPTAVRLLHLRQVARADPDLPASAAVPADVIAVVAAKTGQSATGMTVRTCWRLIAQLGGHQGRRGDGAPGWETLWKGWRAVSLLVEGAPLPDP